MKTKIYKEQTSNNNMRNKRGGILSILAIIILAVTLGSIAVKAVGTVVNDFKDYKEYMEFCENNNEFCYCERFSCEFKIQWNSEEGLSKESREFCEIAKGLEDKKMMFKAGCEE